jgi:hypothetical protein
MGQIVLAGALFLATMAITVSITAGGAEVAATAHGANTSTPTIQVYRDAG